MKRINNIFYMLIALALFFSCQTEELEPVMTLGDAAVLHAPSSGTTIVFEKLGAETDTVAFSWSKADFGFQSATSYILQFDLASNDFSDPLNVVEINDTIVKLTAYELNAKIQGFGVPVSTATDVKIRVVAYVSAYVDSIISEPMDLNITLFASTYPSIYMIGAATGGWDPSLAVEVVSTGEAYMYKTILYFDTTAGSNFRFFNNPDWGASLGGYDVFTNYPTDLLEVAAGDGDPNFNFIGANGWYALDVDTNTGTLTLTATTEPSLFLTGDATHGWDWDDPVSELKQDQYQIYAGDIDFTNGGAFRVFGQKDWGPNSYGYDIITDYDDAIITPALDHGDPNWYFVGESGNYHVVINLRNNIMSIDFTKN